MTRQLYIAKSGTRNAPTIPLDAVTRTFGIFGQRGTGKSNTATVMVEQMVRAGAHVVVIDPKGDWWGITRAGEGRGLPGIVLGGDYGDVPLEEQAGPLVAELVVDRHWPVVVLDISAMRKGARRRFLADFLEKLYDLNRQALHVVFEEAHQALPQMTRREGSGQEVVLNRVIGAAEDIVTLGRKRGLGVTLVSQRFATVNATVREQVETLLLHRLSGPLDRKAAEGWIKTNGDAQLTTRLMNEIAGYKLGEALLYSPGWLGLHERMRMKARKTFDSSATPEVGEEPIEQQAERAPVDLDELRGRMAETVERVKQNDPAELRQRIRQLEQDLADAAAREQPDVEVQQVEVPVPVLPRERIDHLEQTIADIREQTDRAVHAVGHTVREHEERMLELAQTLGERAMSITEALAKATGAAVMRPPAEAPQRQPERVPTPGARSADPPAAAPRSATPADSNGQLRKGERALLAALIEYPVPMTPAQWGTWSGRHGGTYSPRSSTFRNYRATLTRQGLIVVQGDTVALTRTGYTHDAGSNVHRKNTAEELRAGWLGLLRAGERAMFDALYHRATGYPGTALTMSELAEASGFSESSSTFRNYRATLTRLDLAVVSGGTIRLSEWLLDGYGAPRHPVDA